MKKKIKDITAREILDSRSNPTVEARVELESGTIGTASVPSGASTGIHEAHELRDGDKARYGGRGVLGAVQNITDIIRPALIDSTADEQEAIDRKMIALDQSINKANLGANSILAVSLAVARAAANEAELELYQYLGERRKKKAPTPMFNLLNGGAHASNNVDIQEFMVVPHGLPLEDAIRAGSEIYHTLGRLLRDRGLSTAVGDEGGFAPDLESNEMAIKLLCQAITDSGYTLDKVGIALDIASSEWFSNGQYHLPKRNETVTADELIDRYKALCQKYPIISIEDGVAEDDYDGWVRLTKALGDKIMLVGDDFFVTNERRLREGIKLSAANAILIKPNQIGTLTETLKVISVAQESGYKVILSHRSGETNDTAISDIAVAVGAEFIKAGAPCRGERVAKYNRLMEIYSYI
ncbi:MAG: phosphopyruvate hydratase [Clostridia bacterium]|nr:phosphopyruvate hydratase [Clostridia bacterium]